MNLGETINLTKFFSFAPTDEQIKALGEIIQFCILPFDNTNRIFVLKGHAGTGKTSLVKCLLSYFSSYNSQFDNKSPERINFVLLASTGRAAKVLSDKTKRQVHTVHKQIYKYKPDEEQGNSYDSLIFSIADCNLTDNTILVIDESSMLGNNVSKDNYIQFGSGKTLSDLLTYSEQNKIIFIGDSAQLPPVHEKLSIALSPEHIEELFGIASSYYHLQIIKRFTEESSIYTNAKQVLNSILLNEFPKQFQMNFKGDDINVYDELDEMVKQYADCFNRDRNDISNCIFITSTNKLAGEVNKRIRQLIFSQYGFLHKGEFLMITKNNYKYNVMNGDTVKVLHVSPNKETLPGLALSFRQITAGYGIEPYYTTFTSFIIEESLRSPYASLGIDDERALFQNFMLRMQQKRIRTNSSEFINQLMLDPYLNALRVKYGYAVTGHKSQGGEWRDVFIIFQSNLFIDHDKQNTYRWIYTALTRATERLHIYRNIGYCYHFGDNSVKAGIFIKSSFHENITVLKLHSWISKKGTPMCTLVSEHEQYLISQFRIDEMAKDIPALPAIAVIQSGKLMRWESVNEVNKKG